MTVELAFEEFIYSRQLKGLSNKTVESYRLLTSRFMNYIGYETEMENITQEHIEHFIEALYNYSLSIASVGSYIRNTRIFLKWYERKHDVSYKASDISIPRTPKKLVRLYTAEEIELIFQTVNTCSPWLDARNRAMIALMLDSGIRQGEICNLEMDNVHFDSARMKVCGKGNKERFVPLGQFSMRMLQKYLNMRPYDSKRVFVSYYGDYLTCNAVKSMTGDLQNQLPFEFSSHRLRHNFATNYLINQYEMCGHMDIYQLMAIMGHEDTLTTQRYLHEAKNIIASRQCISHLDKVLKYAL
ncbi:MAG: tyrosine-type recombinase/integrase [Lachnospiraceae bacterium]|nr:tyrosine-type recombinase/integrase [Lachnospiraceae bacterium]